MSDLPIEDPGRKRRRKLIKAIRLPHVSGKTSAAFLIASFALTAALIPMAVRLPLWIDFEIVLAVWWVIWACVLARLLYVGRPVSDDHSLGQPRPWFQAFWEPTKSVSNVGWSPWWLWGGEGCAIFFGVLILFFVLVMRVIQNAQTAPDRVGMYICMGVAALLLFHILVNVGMGAGLMPVTGIPLPFMSFGGSSIWTFFLALGLVNNVRLRRFVN